MLVQELLHLHSQSPQIVKSLLRNYLPDFEAIKPAHRQTAGNERTL